MGYVLTDKEYLDLLESSKDIPKLKRILAKDFEEINKQLCDVKMRVSPVVWTDIDEYL